MVRSTYPFRNHVEDMNNGGMKCRFCGHLFSRKTSISRIKWHLSGLKRRGVKICEKVPEEVQDAARAAIDGPPKKRNKYEITNEEAISPGLLDRWMDSMIHDALENDPKLLQSSSPELCSPPVNNDIVTMNDVQNMVNVLDQSNAVHDAGRIPVGVQGTENGMGNTGEEGSIQHVDRSFSLGRHTVDAHEKRREATQRIDLVNQLAGFSMEEEEDDVEDNRGRLVQPVAGDFQAMFPNDIQVLRIINCNDATTLCDISPVIMYATKLEKLEIWECSNMESLFLSSRFCSAPLPLPSSNSAFSGLKDFYFRNCKSMKKLLPLVLLPNLKKLETLVVEECENMEEIIGTTDEEISSSNSNPITEFILPKLRLLVLRSLPELKSICGAKVICDSLEEIKVDTCEKLKRIPICFPLLENGQPSPPPSLRRIEIHPKEWWETVVEWEHPNAKDVLLPFVCFQPFNVRGTLMRFFRQKKLKSRIR